MATLSEDLEKYADEVYTKKDVKAGLLLLGELAGLVSIFGIGAALSTVTIPLLGPSLTRSAVYGLTNVAFEKYKELSTEERKYVRAAISFLNPLGHVSIAGDAGFMADIVDISGSIEDISDKLGDLWENFKDK